MLELMVAALLVILVLLLTGVGVVVVVVYLRTRPPSTPKRPSLTKRIALSDGHWAIVRTHLTQSMWDALVQAWPSSIERNEDGRLIDPVGVDVTDAVTDAKARALMLAGVTEWSYGEVGADVLMNDVPLEDQETLSLYFVDEVVSTNGLWKRAANGA